MYQKLQSGESRDESHPLASFQGPHYDDYLYCWAMAVNEEVCIDTWYFSVSLLTF